MGDQLVFYCDKYKWREGSLKIPGEGAVNFIASKLPFYAYIIVFEKGTNTKFYYKERETIINGTQHFSRGVADNPGGYTYRVGGNFKNIEDYAKKAIEGRFFNNPENSVIIAIAWNESYINDGREQNVVYALRELIEEI
jgi:hypothetical protein